MINFLSKLAPKSARAGARPPSPVGGLPEQNPPAEFRTNGTPQHIGKQVPVFAPGPLTRSQKKIVADFQDLLYTLSDPKGNRSYSINWLGYELFKWPSDIWLYQEIICQSRPDVIIETGTFRGGSALFMACVCEMIGHGEVLTIDPDVREASARPRHPRITYLAGSSVAPEIIDQVANRVNGASAMVILDSIHTRDYVLQELNLYNRFVGPGGILVVEDSHINGHPTYKEFGPGPWEAIEIFLSQHADFSIDHSFERFLVTANPNGFLRKKSISSTG